MTTISASTVNLKRIPEGVIVEGNSISFPDDLHDDFLKQDERGSGHSYDFSYYRQADGSVICHDRLRDAISSSPYSWEDLKKMEQQGSDE